MTALLAADMFPKALTQPTPPMDAWASETGAMAVTPGEIEQIYRNYGGMVYRRCLQILKTDADAMDAMQDVFVRVLRSIKHFRGQASPSTWLYRISTNICLNRIRDKGNRERLRREALEPVESTQPVETWSRDLIVRVLSTYDRTTQEVVIYSIVEGMSYEEISAIMGCSVARVRKCMTRFKSTVPKRVSTLLKERG